MSTLLYCDLTNKKLRRSLGGPEFSFGTLPHIGVIALGLRFSKQVGTRHIEIYPTVNSIRAVIGPLDQRPEAGQFSLKVGSGTATLGTNLTPLLDHNISATDLATALNALSVVGTAAVVADDDTYVITGISDAITVVQNTLRPISFVRVKSYEVNGATTQTIRLQRAPFAKTDSYEEIVPTPPTVVRIQAGGDIDGTTYPEIQKLTIPLEFNGGYRLRREDPVRKSPLLGVADGPEEVAAAINPTSDSVGLADDADGLFVVEEHPTEPAMLISYLGSMAGDSPDLMTVEVFDAPPADHWIYLNPQTAMTEEALRDTDLIRRVPIEIHANLEVEDETDRPYCLYQGECSIKESISHEDLETVTEIDWINPPTAKVYKPVEADSLSSGSRFYPFLLGNGSDVEHQVTHSLNSPRCRVALRENTTGGRELVHGTDYEVEYDSNNALTITLLGDYASSPPASEALTGTVQDLTLTSTWLDPTVPIANVTGLRAELDALAAAISALQATAGNLGAINSTSLRNGKVTRALGSYFAMPGVKKLPENPGSLVGWNPYTLAEPLRSTRLLGAVHLAAGSVESLPSPLPAASSTYVGKVFTTATARTDFPGGGLLAGDYAACDGRQWYRVARNGSETTWYPQAYEIELFRFAISQDDLVTGSVLDLNFGIEAALFADPKRERTRRTAMRWTLEVQYGVQTSDSSPATTGANLDTFFSSATTMLSYALNLTEKTWGGRFGITVTRPTTGSITATATKQFKTTAALAAPSTANFAIRARLTRADVEDTPSDPKGLIALRGFDVGADGQVDNTLGKYTISS